MSIFYPKSIDFIKNRAKLIKSLFPELPLTKCQHATCVALGLGDWFYASNQIQSSHLIQSLPDEDVAKDVRLQRRYQQARALIDILDLPPDEVDIFVRLWNLTSNKPSQLSAYETNYKLIFEEIEAIEIGDVSEDDYDDGPPVIVAPGILHAQGSIKHQYFFLSNERLLAMPVYLRGNTSAFLDFEGGHHVVAAFPHLFPAAERIEAELYLKANEPLLYEWHFNLPSESHYQISLSLIKAEAEAYPDDWIPLSFRVDRNIFHESPVYLPSITGSDFIKFIQSGGSLRGLTLKWFKAKKNFGGADAFMYSNADLEYVDASVRLDPRLIEETTPLYSSPFKHGPMSSIEYEWKTEGGGMMLNEELPKDDL